MMFAKMGLALLNGKCSKQGRKGIYLFPVVCIALSYSIELYTHRPQWSLDGYLTTPLHPSTQAECACDFNRARKEQRIGGVKIQPV